MCSSKHLDRTRSGPGSEQIRRVNNILVRSFIQFTNKIYILPHVYSSKEVLHHSDFFHIN